MFAARLKSAEEISVWPSVSGTGGCVLKLGNVLILFENNEVLKSGVDFLSEAWGQKVLEELEKEEEREHASELPF